MKDWTFEGYDKPLEVSYLGYYLDKRGNCKAFVDLDGKVWLWDGEALTAA